MNMIPRSVVYATGLFTCLAFRIEPGLLPCDSPSSWPLQQSIQLNDQIERVFAATNQVRSTKGKPMLQQDARLTTAAQQYAERMAADDELSHSLGGVTLAQKARKVCYAYRTLSENIAYNTELYGRLVVQEQWMKSRGHRQNMLAGDVSQIGIGIAGPSRRTKRYYYCQIFGLPLSEKAP